jgi:hypothetical protein
LETLLHGTGFTWLLRLPHVRVNVDGLACPLHCPTICSRQTREHGFLLGAALSHRAAVGGGAFLGVAKLPGLVI